MIETKKDLFYYLNNLYTKKDKSVDESEVSSLVWPINRFLSMDRDLLETVAYVSKYMFILGSLYYNLLWRIVPKSSSPRLRYLKPTVGNDEELLFRYSQYFKVGKKETREYLKILGTQYNTKEIYAFVGLQEPK